MNNPNVITPYGSQTVTWNGQPGSSGYTQDGAVTYQAGPAYDENIRQGEYDVKAQELEDFYLAKEAKHGVTEGRRTGSQSPGGLALQAELDALAPQSSNNTGGNQYTNPWTGEVMNGGTGGGGGTNSGGTGGGGNQQYQPTITQSLSPDQQAIFDSNERLQQGLLDTGEKQLGRVDAAFDTPWDTSNAPKVTNYGDMDNSNDVAEALRSRYQPEMDKREQQRMDTLLTQGHTRGGSAWDTEKTDLNQQRNDFELASIVQSESEKRQNDQLQHSIESSDRGRYIGEQAYDRNVPLNETNALRSGNQVQPYQYQGYQGANLAPAPLFDATLAAGNFAQQNYANQTQAQGGMMGGLGQLAMAGATAYASDRRLKENIKPVQKVGELMSYLFNYIGKPEQYIGFMADEIKKIRPDAVMEINGFDHVNYALYITKRTQ